MHTFLLMDANERTRIGGSARTTDPMDTYFKYCSPWYAWFPCASGWTSGTWPERGNRSFWIAEIGQRPFDRHGPLAFAVGMLRHGRRGDEGPNDAQISAALDQQGPSAFAIGMLQDKNERNRPNEALKPLWSSMDPRHLGSACSDIANPNKGTRLSRSQHITCYDN